MKRDTLHQIIDAKGAHRPIAVLTLLDSGQQVLLDADAKKTSASTLSSETLDAARDSLRRDKSASFEAKEGRVFVQVINPPLRMIIVGAVHITQALAPIAATAGYEVIVVDPRRGFASDERFPGLNIIREWPDDALTELAPDTRTAIVTLTHDPKLDDVALQLALSSTCFYIGSLGSKKNHAARLARLKQAGFTDTDLERIHGPIGLPIGAQTPAEIAVAIVSQVTQVLRQGRPKDR